jgi:ribose transport system ATP-binding protein
VAAKGGSIVFVSHDIDEVLSVADRVTVLRDGRVVGTRSTADTTRSDVVELIIGRQLEAWVEHDQDSVRRTLALSVASLSGGLVKDVNLEVHEGEILGIAGLRGSGYEDILYLIFGARAAQQGTLTIAGRTYDATAVTPARAMSAGVVLLPADRQTDGAILSLSVTDNITMNVLHRFMENGLLRRNAMTHETSALITAFDVRPPEPRTRFSTLSGGNQQKALLAKWLQVQPRIFLAHEPTLGVDVGARRQISILLKQATERGTAVICASSDYEELAAICDRVVILAQGRVISELSGAGVTKDRIAERCLTAGGDRDD